MLATIVVANVIGHIGAYLMFYRYFKKTRFYRELLKLHKRAKYVPSKPRDKRDLRKIRKYRPYIRALRGKVTRLLILNVLVFLLVYISILFTSTYISIAYGRWFVETPVIIPFFTAVASEGGMVRLYVHIYVIMLLAMILVVYPVTRETKIAPSE